MIIHFYSIGSILKFFSFADCIVIFIKIPIDALNNIIDVPPKLMKGSVIPVVGIRPVTTAEFIKALRIMLNEIPNPNNCPNVSFEFLAMITPIKKITKYIVSTVTVPNRPNSSPRIEKIKSPS